jgi:hypothetical protein
MAISIGTIALSALVAIAAVLLGSAEVRLLRKETGDRSMLTSVLSGKFFSKNDRRPARPQRVG